MTSPMGLGNITKHSEMAVVVKWLTQRIVAPSCARSNRVSRPRSGDDRRVDTPGLISNPEVKHSLGDDSLTAKIACCQFEEIRFRISFLYSIHGRFLPAVFSYPSFLFPRFLLSCPFRPVNKKKRFFNRSLWPAVSSPAQLTVPWKSRYRKTRRVFRRMPPPCDRACITAED